MTRYIVESRRRVPVTGIYDVVIVGGGIAGVAAAVAAARNGAKVCLIEKENALGGLTTLANVAIYLPLCDGMGHQVVGGLGEELLKLSVRDGFGEIPSCWKRGGNKQQRLQKRYQAEFNPMSFMLELEELVQKSGVAMYYDTRFCDVVKKRNLISAVIVENKSGRSALLCRTAVDASGDADVCARAGEQTVSLRTNVPAGWFYSYDGLEVKLHELSRPYDPHGQKVPRGGPGYAGDNAEDVTAQIIGSRRLIRKRLKALNKQRSSPVIRPVLLPTIPAFRMTRRLKGRLELAETDERRYFADAIGMIGDWRKKGPIYYIPLRCLTGVKTDNLITAGRCISSGATGWDITRIIAACVVTGEAAGTAATLACRQTNGRLSKLNVKTLQDRLIKQKVIIERKFVGRADLPA